MADQRPAATLWLRLRLACLFLLVVPIRTAWAEAGAWLAVLSDSGWFGVR